MTAATQTRTPAVPTNPNPAGAFANAGALAPTNKDTGSLVAPGGNTAGIPYLTFVNKKNLGNMDMVADIVNPKVSDVIIKLKDNFERLDPLIFGVIELSKHMWVERDEQHKALRATFARQKIGNKEKLVEEFNALVLAYRPTGITIAKAQFRSGCAALGEAGAKGLNLVKEESWYKSAESVVTKGIPDNLLNLRFTVTARTWPHACESGRQMVKASGRINPIASGQIAQLSAFISDPDNMEHLNLMRKFYNKDQDALYELAKGT